MVERYSNGRKPHHGICHAKCRLFKARHHTIDDYLGHLEMKLSLFSIAIGFLLTSAKPITWRRISWNFLQKEPLDLDFCKGLGYDFSATMNFFLKRNTSGLVSNAVFRALSLLDRTSCSKLMKPYTCGLLAPPFTGAFGVIPPCRSLCQTAEESCKPILNFFAKFSPIQYGKL